MGNLRNGGQREPKRVYRKVAGLTILFHDRDSIYVTDGAEIRIYHRWFYHPKGSYKAWSQFVVYLKQVKHPTMIKIAETALLKDISSTTGWHMPDLNGATMLGKDK